MSEAIAQTVEREFALITYANLTQIDLRESNYPDAKFGGIFFSGTNVHTGYVYTLGVIVKHDRTPYVNINTEQRGSFLNKGSERQAQCALESLAMTVRERIGGYFQIHPFYGAIYGTHFNPITDFCKGNMDEPLGMTIHLVNDAGQFDDEMTREALYMGNTISVPGPNAQRFLEYMKAVNLRNPNQQDRDQAITNGLGEQWDAEFKKFNPPAKRRWLFFKQPSIPPAMEVTQHSIADMMDYLQELGLRDLRATQANYQGLTSTELDAATLPREKIEHMFETF
ncbi:hypothetical protein C4573_06095 [Candidatus Woesearchaeota archaeon]|nr:MAG: hypothetical protein C4573_06095 [Candidatus Woesearchaeota archaeon]